MQVLLLMLLTVHVQTPTSSAGRKALLSLLSSLDVRFVMLPATCTSILHQLGCLSTTRMAVWLVRCSVSGAAPQQQAASSIRSAVSM
jgi:hypothetical protein